jgi:hypothetical protein
MRMSAIPPGIRKILDSGKGEVEQLQRQYHIWVITTVLAVSAGIILFGDSLLLFITDKDGALALPRILIGLAMVGDFFVSYVVYQETIVRRRYLLEVQKFMISGLSFLDSVRRGLRNLFGE